MTRGQRELSEVLDEARTVLSRPENDFSWSSWADRDAALDEIDRHRATLAAGGFPRRGRLTLLFAPTGPIQEVSISSGWSDEFIDLASRFDGAVASAYFSPTNFAFYSLLYFLAVVGRVADAVLRRIVR